MATPDPPQLPDASLANEVARLLGDRDPAAIARALATRFAGDASPASDILRGEAARRAGDYTTGTVLLEKALRSWPDVVPAWHCAALANLGAGQPERARSIWQSLLARSPEDRIARYQIALTFHDEGKLEQAASWYEQQVLLHPADARAWHNLGICHEEAGARDPAIEAYRRALEVDPSRFVTWFALGTALHAAGRNRAAVDAFARAHALEPRDTRPLARAAKALAEEAELPAAIESLERAIALAPADASLRWNIAAQLSNLARHAEALAQFREAHRLAPQDARGHSALLLELQYDSSFVTRAELAREHWAWGDLHADALPRIDWGAAAPRDTDTRGRVRIGYLSPRFGSGPLANLLLPVLRAHDRRRFHVSLYSAHAHHDDAATAMRSACDAWRELPEDDDDAARMIANDALDLLIDLAGHAPGHRLGVLARKPARVLATWLDYWETSGVDAIDYLIGDAVHTPEAEAAMFRERLALLPHCRFVYAPLFAPPSTPPPSAARGFVTFGSFNRHAKIGAETLSLWKAALEAVPGSRLRLRASAYRGAGTVEWIRRSWADSGMPIDRIDFLPYVSLEEAIADYSNVDIALDTVPYNGGITTCDALSMGVPVVTLPGDRMIARQSAALLAAAGHPEWIAVDRDDFVAIAHRLAQRPLVGIRARLREELPTTPLCDVAQFTKSFERLLALMIEAGPRSPLRAEAPLVAS